MKLVAHRGGSFGKENSLKTMIMASKIGADAVECDIRKTKDGVYVIYHDEDLTRLAGTQATISGVTLKEMQELLLKKNENVLTFEELKCGYKEKTPILLHIKLTEYDEDFAKYIVESGLPIIVGVLSLDMLKCFSKLLPKERILAFLPNAEDAEDYYKNGAGIIRLWEQWLNTITPHDVKEKCPEAKVYVMACNLNREPWAGMSLESMDGSKTSLDKCNKLGADGVLLNNIEMALNWRKENILF